MKKLLTVCMLLSITLLVACNTPKEPSTPSVPLFTLTFMIDQQEIYQTYQVALGSDMIYPENPTKDGYNFSGWYLGNDLYEGTTVAASALTLYAHFIRIVPEPAITYSVTFYDGETVFYSTEIEKNTVIGDAVDPTKTHHHFIGWYIDEDLTTFFDTETTPITADYALYGKWEIVSYTVTLYRENQVFNTLSVEALSVLPTVDTLVAGYDFGGWYLNSNLATVYNTSTPITSSLTLYGKWTEVVVAPNQFVVSFNTNGGSAIASTTVTSGSKITAPQSPTKSGYSFGGWYKDSNLNVAWNFSSDTVISNTTLYAKWIDPTSNTYTGYYASLNGKSGDALKTALTSLIKNTGSATGSTNQVKSADAWQGQTYNIYTGIGAYGNREHVWPESKLGNAPDDDLHNLRAAVISVNSSRSNWPFTIKPNGNNGNYQLVNGNSWYPGDEHVGDVARIVMYISIRYSLNIDVVGNSSSAANDLQMFINWHSQDPVNDFEITRNGRIFNTQSNRNPFIDHPELVSVYYGSAQTSLTYDSMPSTTFTYVPQPTFNQIFQ